MLYLIIQSYVGPNSAHPFPKRETVAHFMGIGLDTLRKYTDELVAGGWLLVEQRRGGWNQFCSNSYILLDGEPCMENPRTAPPVTAEACAADPCAALPSAKNNHAKVRPTGKKSHEVGRRTSSNTVAPAATPVAAPAPFENLSGASAPEPPRADDWTDKDSPPERKTERFIRGFKEWGGLAGLPVSITDRDQEAVSQFFQNNHDYRVRGLIAIMLAAWLMDPEAKQENTDRKKYWYCSKKGRRVLTFMRHLTEIQDELGWRGNEQQIARVLEMANNRFAVKKQKLVA
jgi:hypothetical protein